MGKMQEVSRHLHDIRLSPALLSPSILPAASASIDRFLPCVRRISHQGLPRLHRRCFVPSDMLPLPIIHQRGSHTDHSLFPDASSRDRGRMEIRICLCILLQPLHTQTFNVLDNYAVLVHRPRSQDGCSSTPQAVRASSRILLCLSL